jgi:hypothetical protein
VQRSSFHIKISQNQGEGRKGRQLLKNQPKR